MMADRRSRREDQLTDLQRELQIERAAALGTAGRRLEESISRYRLAVSDASVEARRREELLYKVALDLWSLMVQRESLGAGRGNLEKIVEEYEVPAAAASRVGIVRVGG